MGIPAKKLCRILKIVFPRRRKVPVAVAKLNFMVESLISIALGNAL